jgi:2-dehydropantoate 2-reductase
MLDLPNKTRFAVMGAGAVGCYYGGMLARAGHEVVLIGRPAHVEAIHERGLRIQTAAFDELVKLEASTEPSAVQGADVVLFCVKSTDTESAGALMRPYLAPDATVLNLQNGVDNAERLRTVIAQTVAATVVYVATEMAGPGYVKHHGRGDLIIEPSPASEAIARLMTAAGVPVDVSADVRGSLWAKLIVNCAYNALSAIGQVPYGRLLEGEGVAELMRGIVDECLAVASAEGVRVPGDPHAMVRNSAASMPGQQSSTAQDLARGKPSEIDHLNGYVARRGAAHGIPAPLNRAMQVIVKLLETRKYVARSL